MSRVAQSTADLRSWTPKHWYLVCVDSDGCVFPTMEIKQRGCFQPLIVRHWKLGRVAQIVRETAEFVSLGSRWRGSNRFVALVQIMDFLRRRSDVQKAQIVLPTLNSLREWIASTGALSEASLAQAVVDTGDRELETVLQWSRAVNECIARRARSVPPFPAARRAIETMVERADVVCISQTPAEALAREWQEQKLIGWVRLVVGQEVGSKTHQIRKLMADRYDPDQTLVIGDAPGDLTAAQNCGAHFYPIVPGEEEASWSRFLAEAWPRFLGSGYCGANEAERIATFLARLPQTPPWEPKGR